MIKKDSKEEPKEVSGLEVPAKREKEEIKVGKKAEKKEQSVSEEILLEHLREEIELMKVEESLAKEAEKKAQKIKFLGEKEKIEHLLRLAKQRGIVFAVQVAQKMNEPYVLDIFHDILAQEGYYKQFKLR